LSECFSNTLSASDCATQRKALVALLKEEFDRKPKDVLQHIKAFHHHCKETCVVEDFKYIKEEHLPPSSIDLNDPAQFTAWLADPDRFTYGNILLDSSTATIEKMQQARNAIKKKTLHQIQSRCLLPPSNCLLNPSNTYHSRIMSGSALFS
jgi:hypothetical protein